MNEIFIVLAQHIIVKEASAGKLLNRKQPDKKGNSLICIGYQSVNK